MPSFYIIDGHAHIYRSYFAPFRDLTSPSGEPTKATFVFTQMLLNLVDQRRPDYLAMVIDHGDESVFRKQIYPAYKATRTSPPDDFYPQEQRILRIVRDAGVPVFDKRGYEADDLIATMAERLASRGFDVFMVSKDKDLRQLLSDRVRMYDVQGDEVVDPAAMRAKLGYGPEQSIDIQTLMGDKIDNVPGIPGVGEATAAKLLARYGSIEAIVAHVDELTPKLRENVVAHADKLSISRQLVTLERNVDFDWSIDGCAYRGLNVEKLRPHFRDLGFWSLLKRIGGDVPEPETAAPAKAPPSGGAQGFGGLFDHTDPPAAGQTPALQTSADCDYRLIDTFEKFEAFLKELRKQKRFAFDTETSDLGAMRSDVIGMSFSWKSGQGFYVPVRGPVGAQFLRPDVVLPALKPILEDPSVQKVGHHIKYDMLAMRVAGVELRGIALDTMVAAFLLDAGRNSYGIDGLARDYLHFEKVTTSTLIGKGRNQVSMEKVELSRVARYAAEDADITWRLAQLLESRLEAIPALRTLNDDVETPLIDVLAEMEFNGVAIDPEMLHRQSDVLAERITALRGQIHQSAGREFNIDSTKQLAEVLFERLKLPTVKKTKTGFSTDVEVLEKLAGSHAVPRLILEYRQLMKLKNTYLDELPQFINRRTGRVHGSFHQTGAATGRLSMSDPNLQNIPVRTDEGRAIRLAFVAGKPDSVLLVADYSQIELRVLAHFTREPALVAAFDRDEDVHRAVAAEVFGVAPEQVSKEQRAQAKIINFGIIYGVTAQGLARRIDGLDVRGAAQLIKTYNQRFPGIERFLNQCIEKARADGYVQTILGRRRPVTDIHSAVVALRNAAERIAINSVVQGSAADLIKVAMIRIHRRLMDERRPSRMLLQVHDELVFETPESSVKEEAEMIRHEMTGAIPLTVPVKVEVGWGRNWEEGK